jgi:uncharacterized protein YjiS (DUF1127 family)
MSWPKRYFNYLMTWRYHRQLVKEINRLDDKILHDIGIKREYIDQLIWLEIDKQNRGKKNNG